MTAWQRIRGNNLKKGIVVGTILAAVVALYLVLTSGPYGAWLASPLSFGRVAKQDLSVAEAAADVEVFAELMREAYAEFDQTAAKQGCDWDKIFAAMKTAVTSRQPRIAVSEMMELIAANLACTGDRHIQLFARDADGQKRGTWPSVVREHLYLLKDQSGAAEIVSSDSARATRIRCDDETRTASAWPVLTGGGEGKIEWRVGVLLPGDGEAEIDCELSTGTSAEAREPAKMARPAVSGGVEQRPRRIKVETGQVAEVGVHSCDPAKSLGWQRLYDATDEIRRSQVILLDLRGNHGGWDFPMLHWFVGLTKGDFAYIDNISFESNVALQGRANRLSQLVGAERDVGIMWWPRLKETGSSLLTLQARRIQNMGRPFRRQTTDNLRWNGLAETPYQGRIIVFVDNGCASACECAVAAAAAMPGTIVIGENTRGLMASGKILPFVLPQSGVTVKIPNYYGGPSGSPVYFEERQGFWPDLVVDSDRPYDVAKGLAHCLLSPGCAKAVDAAVEQRRRQVRELRAAQ